MFVGLILRARLFALPVFASSEGEILRIFWYSYVREKTGKLEWVLIKNIYGDK